jgi:hypothetical protein
MMGRSWSRAAFILAMAVPLAGASAAAAGPSALASTALASTAGQGDNLQGVSAVSATDAWAVGYQCSNAQCSEPDLSYSSLIEHWNGTKWSTVASPNPTVNDQLTGVSAVSATDAWAVGNGSSGPLILHWNGTTWSKASAPDASSAYFLNGVNAISATDAWAVGGQAGSSTRTLILHWNGTKWSQVASPNPSTISNGLYGVSAASASDAWAVGRYLPGSSATFSTLTEHWNGTKWSDVASPSPGATSNALFGVSTLTPADAWAVGDSLATQPGQLRTVVLHWNGQAWTQVASPDPGASFNVLDGVSAVSASDAWAVGNYSSNKGLTASTLILRWNGKDWTRVPSPSPNPNSSGYNNLAGVSTVSPDYAVAAGSSVDTFTGVNLALIEDWNGSKWAIP